MQEREGRYVVDPDDPRAPSQDVWDRMSDEERAAVVAALPSEFPVTEAMAPEGDTHFEEKVRTRDTLRRWFQRRGRSVYLACELPVYYPGEPMFAPDVMAVLDVSLHSRDTWTVSAEGGRGLDVALEIHVHGRRRKDMEENVVRFARLGIPEYFVFEVRRQRLWGWRLDPSSGSAYQRLVPQGGRLTSHVLDLDLTVESGRLRFMTGHARLPDSDEIIARLDELVDQVTSRAEGEARRAEEEARRAEALERQVAELRARLGETEPD